MGIHGVDHAVFRVVGYPSRQEEFRHRYNVAKASGCFRLLENVVDDTSCIKTECPHHVYRAISVRRQKNMRKADCSSINGCMFMVNHPLTLDEVGQILGISRERVRQIEEKVLNKLRKRAGNLEMEMG